MAGIKLQLTERGYEKYTGQLSEFEFVDGVSEELSQRQADLLAGIMRVEVVESDAKVGAGRMLGNGDVTAQPEQSVEQVSETDETEETGYTREELEAIADKDGIGGLRAVGDVLGVKGRSIEELIGEIVNTGKRVE